MLILDKVTYPAIPVFYGAGARCCRSSAWWDGLVGAAVGYGVPWLIGEIYFRIRKREGLGLGDARCSRWSARCSAGAAWSRRCSAAR